MSIGTAIVNAAKGVGNWILNNPTDAATVAGTAAGIGFMGYGAWQAGKKAEEQQELAEQALDMQNSMLSQQTGNLAFQQDLLGREINNLQEQREYLRSEDALNRKLAERERQEAFNLYYQNNEKLQQERNYFIQRQEFLDKQAAADRAQQLEFMLANQQIAAQEREFALQELYRAQQIAQGERDEELRQFYDNQYRAAA